MQKRRNVSKGKAPSAQEENIDTRGRREAPPKKQTLETGSRETKPRTNKPMNVDDGLEYVGWIRGLGGGRLPAVSYAPLPNLDFLFYFIFCHLRRREKLCRLFPAHRRLNGFLIIRLASDRHLSPIGHCVNPGCGPGVAGVPIEHALSRVHEAVVCFVGRCLSRTRNLAASNSAL